MEKISEIIRRELLDCGRTLRDVAQSIGVDHTQLSRFARSERTLRQAVLDALAAELKIQAKPTRRKR